ncbi:sulfurtransferase FdhD [Litorivicinus lipolyticus]|uniref:Sulfur carrier protein FdhD n=1 Tax=Litorivicinus lipolyticus TaxID=418701 RepID=A0A5Q2QE23_9GAMM|nr:formate dehydrogenase accessory sulfurtransferase FdhD [Litorivicinus lipolyticus]QGG79265.1 sulfurtransferase FdhD [Litorivicinus lipolyticus]
MAAIFPNPNDPKLSRRLQGIDERGHPYETSVIEERPLTIYLNRQEIVTAMTIGDYPEYLALGFLLNQGMLGAADRVTAIDFDPELEVVVVRTAGPTDVEDKLEKKTRTSGCAVGTVFGDMMAGLDGLVLAQTAVKTSSFYDLSYKINHTPSLYMETGAIHGTALCQGSEVLAYMEDVGRHNAVDKIAGWMRMNDISAHDKVLYTTGRLTSEMVIKTALMGIPTLISRSGFTAWGVDIARQVGLTLVGRMRGRKFTCLSGQQRLEFDQDLDQVADESRGMRRKGAES